MRPQKDSRECVKSFLREVTGFSRSVEHPDCSPYVVRFIGACLSPFCIVTDLCEGGSLSYILHERRVRFPARRASEIALRIALGMRGLHSLKPPIMHRDLTTHNVAMHPNEFGDPYILDFSISRFVDKMTVGAGEHQPLFPADGDSPRPDSGSSSASITSATATYSPIGPLRYRPPEIRNNQTYYSKRVDVYFFGTVFYELLTGLKPFAAVKRDRDVARMVAHGERPEIPDQVPDVVAKLVRRCWSGHPKKRPSFKEIVKVLTAFINPSQGSSNKKRWGKKL